MVSHLCPAGACPVTLPDHLLMCRPHWYMVPGHLRTAVYGAYRHGAGVGSMALFLAHAAAINAVQNRLAAVAAVPASTPTRKEVH